jgi:N,N'-diacetylbacillosaminyl-diphospho-undecaprenol alpha-1,3-N-acetylgalactosaminyltransferase
MSNENDKPTNGNDKNEGEAEYGADSIKVLKGLDAVRKRPGMYIGDTDDGNISCASKEFLNSGDVVWLGHRDDIQEQIELCDIFVLPSYREGVPRTLLEASSLAKPIVTTNTVGCREVVDDGLNGFLVPVSNSEILAAKIKELIDSKELRDTFGKNGRIKALEEFDIEIVVKKYLKVYQK